MIYIDVYNMCWRSTKCQS